MLGFIIKYILIICSPCILSSFISFAFHHNIIFIVMATRYFWANLNYWLYTPNNIQIVSNKIKYDVENRKLSVTRKISTFAVNYIISRLFAKLLKYSKRNTIKRFTLYYISFLRARWLFLSVPTGPQLRISHHLAENQSRLERLRDNSNQ